MNKRTDMAVESVVSDFKYDVNKIINGMNFKKIYVDEKLAKKIGKKSGVYYNIDELDYRNNSKEIIKLLSIVIYDHLCNLNLKEKSQILVVGLGNDFVTPDALGPLTINKIEVNRHLENCNDKYIVSAMCAGVMGQTGMESMQVVRSIVNEFKPDLVIVIDALACNKVERMCNSIQLTDVGINPGSGIYNFRKEISKATIGTEVLAIGVPTVSDIDCFTEIENVFFVTPKDIDQAMDILSQIIAEAINIALKK